MFWDMFSMSDSNTFFEKITEFYFSNKTDLNKDAIIKIPLLTSQNKDQLSNQFNLQVIFKSFADFDCFEKKSHEISNPIQ